METKTTDIIIYVFLALLTLAIIIFCIIVCVKYAGKLGEGGNSHKNYPLTPSESPDVIQVDASGIVQTKAACVGNNLQWTGTNCVCAPPFYGTYCGKEKVDNTYLQLPIENNKTNMTFTTEKINGVTSLSYNGTNLSGQSCTGICDTTVDCQGVVYDETGCYLITSNIEILPNAVIGNKFNTNGTVYVNEDSHVILDNRVILYTEEKPIKYWEDRYASNPSEFDSRGFMMFNANAPTMLNWIPSRILNDSSLVGIWSNEQFSDVKSINSPNIYIDRPKNNLYDYELTLPDYIKNSPTIYVAYVTPDNVPKLKIKYS